MNVPREMLTIWRGRMERLRNLTISTQMSAARRDQPAVQSGMQEAHDLAIFTGVEMEQHGADRPAHMAAPTGFETPLDLLNSSANKRLMSNLRAALEQAHRVDDERGVERGEGAVSGIVGMLLGQVEMECYGPTGARE